MRASLPASDGTIQGCYTKVGGILRVIDTGKGEHRLSYQVPISWNQRPERRPRHERQRRRSMPCSPVPRWRLHDRENNAVAKTRERAQTSVAREL